MGLAETGDLAALNFDALFGFLARVREGREGQTSIIKLRIARLAHGRVRKVPNVGHVDAVIHDAERVGISPSRDRTDQLALGHVDHAEAEVRDVGTVQVLPVAAHHEVVHVAIGESLAAEGRVERHFRLDLVRLDVDESDAALLTATPIQGLAVRGVGASAGVALRVGLANHGGFALPVAYPLPCVLARHKRLRSVRTHRHAKRVVGDGRREPGGGQQSALGQDGHTVRIVLGVGVHRRHVQVGSRRGENEGCEKNGQHATRV